MSIIKKIFDSDARPQPLSPLFTRLPLELRLMIYTFVFSGCQAWLRLEIKFDREWRDVEGPKWEGRWEERNICRYEHFGGVFRLLRTCRMAYIEAFDTYWSEAVLRLTCPATFETYCNYISAAIKANVRHIRNANLPILGRSRRRAEDPYRVPAKFAEFPKLISCAFFCSEIWSTSYLAGDRPTPRDYLLKVPDTENKAQSYEGVGPFKMKSGESPAAYVERTIGVRLSDGVTILSYGFGLHPQDFPRDYKPRMQAYNWATGMVYQISSTRGLWESLAQEEEAYQQVIRAQPGDEWSRSYDVLD